MDSQQLYSTDFVGELADRGFVHLPAPALQRVVGWGDADWADFAGAWDRLGEDRYMADGGRYRRRRHASFEARGGDVVCEPHQPHYQSRDYNVLNGDVVDWVLVMLIARENVTEGVTEIGGPDGRSIGRFTLRDPGDAVLLDDRRIRHGVTPIRALLEGAPAWRDALVVTWRRKPTAVDPPLRHP